MAYEEQLNGKMQMQGELVPDNGVPFQPISKVRYIKGATQTFENITDLVEFHPNLMLRGMSLKIVDAAPSAVLKITEYILVADPATMLDPVTLTSFVTIDNFLDYWVVKDETNSNFERVQEYAPDDTNGARPPYPYESAAGIAFEVNWVPAYSAASNHKWLRFRDDDIDDNVDGIFDNWTVPIALGTSILGGDFIANLYTRQNVTATIATNQGELVVTNLGSSDSGWFQVTVGDIDEDDGTTITNRTVGKYFKYDAGNTYTFNNSATATQTLPPPATTDAGISNDNGVYTTASGLAAVLYTDDIPAGTDDLWEILGQKSVYGALKSDWSIRRISEDPSLTRYAISFSALPDTACSTTEDAGAEPFNTDLINIGWEGTFQIDTTYLATRTDLGGGTFSDWNIKKIAGESGEFKDRVFKLFPINTDFDQETPPSGADAIAEGWSDTPLAETPTEINGVSESTKYFDGTLKTPWSVPVAYTGQDTIHDVIVNTDQSGNTFKFDPNSATPTIPTPLDMTLEAQLFKGITELWINETITYVWTRIYNNGAVDTTVADADTGKTFYYLGTSGTPGQPDNKLNAQRLFVTHQGVDGKAVFQCVQTLVLPDATTVVQIDEYVIQDFTDGKDAKSLDISADSQVALWDTGTTFVPSEIRLSAFQNNLPSGFTLFWYEETAPSTWTKLVSGVGGYTFAAENYGGQMQIDVATVFANDATPEEIRYAVSTIDGDPDTNDNIASFSDYVTIHKADISAVGTNGEQAVFGLLTNEAHVIVLDNITESPVAGEIGSTGNARSLINVYDGSVKIVQGAGSGKYLVTALASSNANITPAQQISGNDVELYISAWTAEERETKITATIEYVTGDARGTITLAKVFSVNSTLDAPGAILVSIDSADGRFSFYPEDLTDIDLTANLYNDALTPSLQDPANYYYSWKVGSGAFETVKAGGGGTLGEQRTITRAEIRLNGLVEVRVFTVASPTIPTDILRTNSVDINDIQDGKTFHLYHLDPPGTPPAPPAATIDPAVGDGSWLPASTGAIWGIDGTQRPYADWGAESTPEYDWSDPYQIGGEDGDQGDQGGGYFNMYSIYDNEDTKPTFPSGNTSSIDQMIAGVGQDEWEVLVPSNDKIWITQRLYQGFTPTSLTVKIDGSGKLVGGDDSAAVPVTGSTWSEPVLLSGKDGVDGGVVAGNFIERRYQGSETNAFATFVDTERNAGTNWSTTKPSITGNNYIFETSVYIDPFDDSIQSVWAVPVLIHNSETKAAISAYNYSETGRFSKRVENKRLFNAKLRRQPSITARDSTATDGTDVIQDQLINNMRTRINELEDTLKALKLLN